MTPQSGTIEARDVTQADDDTQHIVCCQNPDVALCGEDATDMVFMPDDPDIGCIPCEFHEWACTCPLFGACLDP